jgi:hypothetical protein
VSYQSDEEVLMDGYEPNFGCPELGGFEPSGSEPGSPELGSQRWRNPLIEPESTFERGLDPLKPFNGQDFDASGHLNLDEHTPIVRPIGWEAYSPEAKRSYLDDQVLFTNLNFDPPKDGWLSKYGLDTTDEEEDTDDEPDSGSSGFNFG